MTALIHHTNTAPFAAFDASKARVRSGAEAGVVWFAAEQFAGDLAMFGQNVCRADVDTTDAETVIYTDFAEDGDSMYLPEVMADALASTTADVVRIRRVTMGEFGSPITVYAVRNVSLITITGWDVEDEDEE